MSDGLTKYNISPSIEDKDIYKVALDTRNFEISLFWQRSNYFLVLNSALVVGFLNLTKLEYAFPLAAFGFFVSVLWLRVNLGSKFWQSRWEQRLSEIERKISPDLQFFAADWNTIRSDVERSLKNNNHQGCFHQWLDNQVMKKHSVSYNMTLLSIVFCLGWWVLVVIKFLSHQGVFG